MLNRSILRKERSVLLEVLEKHQRVDVLGFKTELRRTGWNVGIVSGGGWGGRGSQGAVRKGFSRQMEASCKAWKCESI